MKLRQTILGLLIMTLVLSGITAEAFSWMEVGEGAAAGAVAGAVIGTAVPGIGTLVGAGVGALGGALASIVVQLLSSAPTTSSSSTDWQSYQEDVYYQMYQESVSIADNEINIVNVLKETSEVYVVTAQKYEQVNYNINVSPATPKEFYGLLAGTGFLGTAFQMIGAPQELWVEAQGQINQFNNLIFPHTGDIISYDNNPNATAYFPFGYSLNGEYFIVVQGNVTLATLYSNDITILCDNGQPTNEVVSSSTLPLSSGYYLVKVENGQLKMNPNYGAALLFSYTGSSYQACPVSFNTPSIIELKNPTTGQIILSNALPTPSVSPFYAAEEIAIEMLAAAEAEYTALKTLGYTNASQLPASFQLPTLNLNVPLNFSNVSSLQEYNLLMSEYVQYLLAINKTLTELQAEGRLQGLQNLTFDFPSPLQYYGEQGGFIYTGPIETPYGILPNATYLIQPYGGPLSLTSTGGVIPSGGAVAYSLIKTPNGYVLGNYSILPPGSILYGKVLNPGTLYPVEQVQNISNIPSETYSPITSTTTTSSSSSSSTLSNIVQYLQNHPLVLIVTIFFGLIILVAIIRALL